LITALQFPMLSYAAASGYAVTAVAVVWSLGFVPHLSDF
jgi:hypothetical protein